MGLFQTTRGGQGIMNAYELQSNVQLPDISPFFHGLQAQAKGRYAGERGKTGTETKDKDYKALTGAASYYEKAKLQIDNDDQQFLSSLISEYEQTGQGVDQMEWLQQNQGRIAKQATDSKIKTIELDASRTRMEADATEWAKLNSDEKFGKNAVLDIDANGRVITYGKRRDGTTGRGILGAHVTGVATGKQFLHYVDQEEQIGAEMFTPYDPEAGREQIRQSLLDKYNKEIGGAGKTREGFLSASTSNLSSLLGTISTINGVLSKDARASLLNEALSEARQYTTQDGTPIDGLFIYEYTHTVRNGKVVRMHKIGEDGNPVMIDIYKDPHAAIRAKATDYAINMAIGTENVHREEKWDSSSERGKDPRSTFWPMFVNREIQHQKTNMITTSEGIVNAKASLEASSYRIQSQAKLDEMQQMYAKFVQREKDNNTEFAALLKENHQAGLEAIGQKFFDDYSKTQNYQDLKLESLHDSNTYKPPLGFSLNPLAPASAAGRLGERSRRLMEFDDLMLSIFKNQAVESTYMDNEERMVLQNFRGNEWNGPLLLGGNITHTRDFQVGGKNDAMPIMVGGEAHRMLKFKDEYGQQSYAPGAQVEVFATEQELRTAKLPVPADKGGIKYEPIWDKHEDLYTAVTESDLAAYPEAVRNTLKRRMQLKGVNVLYMLTSTMPIPDFAYVAMKSPNLEGADAEEQAYRRGVERMKQKDLSGHMNAIEFGPITEPVNK